MQHIILLRGVNVGGRNMKMEELKSCLKKAGFENVITVLQTGNVIAEAGKISEEDVHAKVISVLEKAFHYPARVLVISPEKLQQVVNHIPFKEKSEDYHRYVLFTSKGFETELVKNSPELDNSLEEIVAGKDVVYWKVKKGLTLDSTFGKYQDKASNKEFITNRNLNTLEKIIAKTNL